MNEAITLRRRPHRKGARLHLGDTLGPGALAAAGPAGPAPRLTMSEPEDARRAMASGTFAFLVHAGVILAMLIFTWMHPELVEEVIPVQLLPGSDVPPAPAPRTVEPRQLVNAAVAPAVVAPSAPAPALTPQANPVAMARIDPMAAPTQIQRRDVSTERVAAVRTTDAVPQMAPVDVSPIGPTSVRPSRVAMPNAPVAGPRTIQAGPSAQSAAVVAGASQAFSRAGQAREHSSQAASGGLPGGVGIGGSGGDGSEFAIDTGVSSAYVGGSGAGGTGTSVGTVPCLQSQYVQDYLAVVKARTEDRWVLSREYEADTKVVLRFTLDAAGTARDVSFKMAADEELGRTAVDALRAASPFPPMDDNVRCLSGKGLTGTFRVSAGG